MKIAQISTSWLRTPPEKYGGTEQVVGCLTEQLISLGHDVTLFATGDSITTGKLWSWYDTPTHNFELVDELLHVSKAYAHISRSDFDIIHNHTYTVGPALFSLFDHPNLTTLHYPRSRRRMYYNLAFAKENCYVSISQNQQKSMPEINWVGNVHNAINIDDYQFREEKDDYLLFIGKVAPWKGAHIAIQVAKFLGRRLKVAGPTWATYFEEEIAPQVDDSLIEYVGEVGLEQKVSLYQRAAAVLVPMQWEEPFGMVMIEALACGTPVIAFRRGAAPEIVTDGEVGFIVDTAEEMSAATRKLKLISPHACREHAVKHFNARLMAERYVDIYQRVLMGKSKK
jgi:glycosyltransferase involved in cell wall biosynthesis